MIWAIVFCLLALTLAKESPEVKTKLGRFRGKYLESWDGRQYSGFFGIRYAETPERFQAAKPIKTGWDDLKDVTEYGSVCTQKDFIRHTPTGKEDCLFLNVFTPDVKGNFPVMVSIHGGGFIFGSAEMSGPKHYMDEDVVLVSINYRLGAFGFLSTGDNVIPGNFGLKDQNLALRWVQENIKYFGGDKDRVTIFGVSAGAASVSYHTLSPLSKGLFHKAIIQSGSALNPWAFLKTPKAAANKLANDLECPTDSKEFLKCLAGKTAEEILAGQAKQTVYHMDPLAAFAPVIEPESEDAFLSECPLKLLKEGRFNKVPLIATITKDEGQILHAAVILANAPLLKDLNEKWEQLAPVTFYYNRIGLTQKNENALTSDLKEFYFKGKEITKASQQRLSNLYSDRWFVHGVQENVLLHAKHSPAYAAIFRFKPGKPNLLSLFGVEDTQGIITHGDDVRFHHNSAMFGEIIKGSEQEKNSKLLVKLWVEFASSSPVQLKLKDFPWSQVSAEEIKNKSLKWLALEDNPKIISGIYDKRMKFWDEALKKYEPVTSSSDKGVKEEL